MIGAILAVVSRELRRFERQRGRLLSTFARPLIWLVVIGSGLQRVVPAEGTVSYKQFMLPGIFGMVLLFSTMLTALATVSDREFGPIRMILVAPLPRTAIVVAKTLSAAILGIVQCLLLLPLIWILGLRPSFTTLLAFLVYLVLGALALATLGMLLASRLRSIENFATVMNFVMFPMFFLSGSLYPSAALPGFLQPFVRANPVTYCVDIMRHPLLEGLYPANFASDYTVRHDAILLLGFSVVFFALASLLFGSEEHLGKVLLLDQRRRSRALAFGARRRMGGP